MVYIVLFGVVWLVVSTVLLQWLWNETMPELFGMPTVTFWQAFRLVLIAAILMGGPAMVNFNLGG